MESQKGIILVHWDRKPPETVTFKKNNIQF